MASVEACFSCVSVLVFSGEMRYSSTDGDVPVCIFGRGGLFLVARFRGSKYAGN
ncbi:hypothetical protein DPMN_093422 [Dreissena polymorpha]|uniref:Uncharacterized protein n=1 Tax=Dreissena polymorpha TaxID=45954 RepID=A0A9D4L5P7_DREPO|nr:hypothetical protein DPMN_093422 [Dreissena polymorpha]